MQKSKSIRGTKNAKISSNVASIEPVLVKMDDKAALINIFKACLNILRDNEGLTGEKALRNMSYLLILKLIEPHIGAELDFDNYKYAFEDNYTESDEVMKDHKANLMRNIRFSNFIIEPDNHMKYYATHIWNDILCDHPATKQIFLKNSGFNIKSDATFKKLGAKLNSIDMTTSKYDILGNAYEEVIQDIMTGKVLGQFFTQPIVKNIMVQLIDPQIHPDGTIETCCDPTMGTGGFLITYLRHILKQARERGITPNWEFIKDHGLFGKEIEPDTYQLAVSNMLISSGHMFDKLQCGDSIRDPIDRKFDNILANPPFGIKGFMYNEIPDSGGLKFKYTPIESKNAVSLFLQAIIYMLKVEGKCAVVVPNGKDTFSQNQSLMMIREYLMKTCDLREIIHLPSGIFTNTAVSTCIWYFVVLWAGRLFLPWAGSFYHLGRSTGPHL